MLQEKRLDLGTSNAAVSARHAGRITATQLATFRLPVSATPPPILIHVQRGNARFGPFPVDQIQGLLTEKRLQPDDRAWHDGAAHSLPLTELLRQLGITLVVADPNASLKWVLPVGRSPLAIAAGYAGLFSVLLFPGPIALTLGLFALRDFKKHPERLGRGRAWFGIIMGGIGTAFVLLFIAAAVAG